MRIKHAFNGLAIEKETNEDAAFMLANKNGSYLFLRENPASRYEGLFFFDGRNMYKTLENINIKGRGTLKTIKNNLYCVEREFSNAGEKFFMPQNSASIIYELDREKEVEIFLDFKDSYDNKEFGRYYDIFREESCLVARFTKRSDIREDKNSGMEQYSLYLAIKSDADEQSYAKIEEWIGRQYTFDEKRNSKPYSRYVLHAFNLKGKKFVFSMAAEKNKAIKEAGYIFNNLENIKENEKNAFYRSFSGKKINQIAESKKLSNEIKMAYLSALNSLNNLTVKQGNFGILAGLPWFFQAWSRDEAISMKALENIDKEFAKNLIIDRLEKIQADGRLPNLYYSESGKTNADAIGWLFFRAFDMCRKAKNNLEILEQLKAGISKIKGRKIRHEKIIAIISRIEKNIAGKEKLNRHLAGNSSEMAKSMEAIIKTYMKNGLIYANQKETWMDTTINDESRAGFNIEIQALTLAMLNYSYESAKNMHYKKLESELKSNIIKKFWNNNILADNLENDAVRPNIFLAYYIYPQLLGNKDWEKCFDNALKALWLDFGGLSTIDKKSPLFVPSHTGENVQSYHHGDSWFWINNLAAIAMLRLNSKKYKSQINKILDASAQDILWKGIIGAHSELSSAEKLKAEGCLNQAWSNAMFVELIDSLFEKG
ncbi:MAG: amylo-alpha-1,6-glucosidase [Nanoarchaeota archaeon]